MPQDGSPPLTLTITPNPQVTNVAASTGAFGRLGLDPRGTVQWNGGDNFSYFGHDWATNDNAQLEIFDDPQLGAAVRAEQEPDPPPDAVWTTTPRELIRDGAAPLYSSTTPDVALTPRGSATPPIPYDTWARPTHPLQFPSSVRAAGQNVMVLRSQETLTYGAEQGVAMGVKSGTIMGPVQPLEHSTTVRAEGSEVIRDGDAVWMNNRNNLGVAELAGSTVANGPTPPEPEEEPGFWGSLWDGAGDAWDATKEAASDAAAAIGEFDRNHGAVLTRGVGVVQAVGGVGEAILGAGLVGGGGAASATGVGAAPGIPAMVGGAALWVNGWDNAVTGMRTAWTGEFQHNLMSEAIGGTAGALGASPETVESIMNTTDLASGALSIGGGVAAGTRAAGRETLEVASRQVDEVAETTSQQTARVTRNAWTARSINGRKVFQRNDIFDPHYIDEDGLTNIERMADGRAPIGIDGEELNLHHLTQTEPGTLVEMTQTMHQENRRLLHSYLNQWDKTWVGPDGIRRPYASAPPSLDRAAFGRYRTQYWMTRANDF
ncbi:DUF4150 domain-containing protein (plasmid) [Rhodobacteraceae bacterium S2214]|nr:DUF4150 domain-containing protein [Rhodobacteraceae bacterium S2214]